MVLANLDKFGNPLRPFKPILLPDPETAIVPKPISIFGPAVNGLSVTKEMIGPIRILPAKVLPVMERPSPAVCPGGVCPGDIREPLFIGPAGMVSPVGKPEPEMMEPTGMSAIGIGVAVVLGLLTLGG